MFKAFLALAVFLFTLTTGRFALAADSVVYLPEGEVELTDLMSPDEIYADMLQQGLVSELDLSDLSATPTAASSAKLYILVSKAQQHLWVYKDNQLLSGYDWKVSTGTEQMRCPPAPASCRIAHTPTGIRHPGLMDWTHYSSLYGNAPMHRAIQFVGGVFLHATYGDHIAMLGKKDSGGCVRQLPANAEKLFLLVKSVVDTLGREAVTIEITEKAIADPSKYLQ